MSSGRHAVLEIVNLSSSWKRKRLMIVINNSELLWAEVQIPEEKYGVQYATMKAGNRVLKRTDKATTVLPTFMCKWSKR